MRPIYVTQSSESDADALGLKAINYVLIKPEVDEGMFDYGESCKESVAKEYVSSLARIKMDCAFISLKRYKEGLPNHGLNIVAHAGQDAYTLYNPRILVGLSSILYIEGRIMGRPKSNAQAREWISLIRSRIGEVFTGISLIDVDTSEVKTSLCITGVQLSDMTDAEVETYVNTLEPFMGTLPINTRAKGSLLVKSVVGDLDGTTGLPLYSVTSLCTELGYRFTNLWWS